MQVILAPGAAGWSLCGWKTWNERQPKTARLQREEDSSWHGLIVSPVTHGLLKPREPPLDFPQPSIKTKRNPLWVTLHLSASHPLLILFLPLKRPPLTQQWEKRGSIVFLPLPPHLSLFVPTKSNMVMGRLLPFICLAHCTAYCEAVISVRNKFVVLIRLQAVALQSPTWLHTGGPDVATAAW